MSPRDVEVSDIALLESAWLNTKEIMDRLQNAIVRAVKRKKRVILGDLWVCLFAHAHGGGGWAHTHVTQHAQGNFSDLCLIISSGCVQVRQPKESRAKKELCHEISWAGAVSHKCRGHSFSFLFCDMLKSLTQVYLLVYCLQSSAKHLRNMMSNTPGHLFWGGAPQGVVPLTIGPLAESPRCNYKALSLPGHLRV